MVEQSALYTMNHMNIVWVSHKTKPCEDSKCDVMLELDEKSEGHIVKCACLSAGDHDYPL